MKKYHDQLLRNIHGLLINSDDSEFLKNQIYAEVLQSVALPASAYAEFKNIRFIRDLVYNGQQTSISDIVIIVAAMADLLKARSYKQHNMPLEFYQYLCEQITDIAYELCHGGAYSAKDMLEKTVVYLDLHYGWKTQAIKMKRYELKHPIPLNKLGSSRFDYEELDPAYVAYWKEYAKVQRTIRFPAYWLYSSMLTQLAKLLADILG